MGLTPVPLQFFCKMKLINLRFANQTSDGPDTVDRFVLVDVADREFQDFLHGLEDGIASYMESVWDDTADTPYTNAVKDIMTECGRNWVEVNPDDIGVIKI